MKRVDGCFFASASHYLENLECLEAFIDRMISRLKTTLNHHKTINRTAIMLISSCCAKKDDFLLRKAAVFIWGLEEMFEDIRGFSCVLCFKEIMKTCKINR
ncbi:CLUMA_CG016679, isoform A [Clunio marinus]|uniref:CLUMA_CG016679, isoform A n=1 Tax=Clunio marinus TaxID=568069 RepID=A0A1J1IS87_9DIPT|nr:CLUMA_CG016679, isoform A [Clunio marinus]